MCSEKIQLDHYDIINHIFVFKNYFYWFTGERTHLGCWENTRSNKLVNSVLTVCRLSYFAGKPKESAAWPPEVITY